MENANVRNYETREWSVRYIPVRVKGKNRGFKIPKLWLSVFLGACLYLAVHLNRNAYIQGNGDFLRRGTRDLSNDYPIQEMDNFNYDYRQFDIFNGTIPTSGHRLRFRIDGFGQIYGEELNSGWMSDGPNGQ